MKTPLIVNEAYAANDGTTVGFIDKAYHLKKGSIAFFDTAGKIIAANVSGPAAIVGDTVNIVVGLGDGKVININDVTRDSFRYNYNTYAAAVLKKMIVGGNGSAYSLNLPSTIPAGAVAIVHVYNTSQLNDTMPYQEFVVPVAVGASAANIVAAVVATVNANSKTIVTAAAVSTDKGITFTAKAAFGYNFAVTVGGILANADILEHNLVNHKYVAYTTGVTAFKVGNGLTSQLLAAEDYFFATRGDGNYDNAANDNLYTKMYLTNPALTYDQYNCTYHLNAYPLKKSPDFVNDLTIYINDDIDALKTAIDTILAAL